jgi:hypothetical protein
MDNRFFQLPFQFDVSKLLEDLKHCEAAQWQGHYNKNDYEGDWTGIALRSPTGNTSDLLSAPNVAQFQDTQLLQHCPYFREILDQFACEKENVRLLALSPGSDIKTHRDRGMGYPDGCFRIHIPITTDEQVDFIVDGQHLHMAAGSCWYANFDLPHSVRHRGQTRRIHLVMDCQRNAWSDALFGRCGYDFEAEKQARKYSLDTVLRMIEMLQLQKTEAADALIVRLQQEYGLWQPPSGTAQEN